MALFYTEIRKSALYFKYEVTRMKIKIGNKIKSLRKQKGVTQEQLAFSIGISCQAVSKWENHIALPDITLVPSLASYFNCTIDELFDYNLLEKSKKIKLICDEAYKYRESTPVKAREILEEGLTKYPDNEILLNNLLYTISHSTNPDEIISIASKLISETSDDEVKYDALRFLAYAYHTKGEATNAVAAIEQIPEFYFTKLTEMAFIATGIVKFEAAEKQKWLSIENSLQMMSCLINYYESEANYTAALAEATHALALLNALSDEGKYNLFKKYSDSFNSQIHKCKTR